MEELDLDFSLDLNEVEYDEPITDASSSWWKTNYSNLKKFKIHELEAMLEAPSLSQHFQGLLIHVLSLRKKNGEKQW